MAYNKAKEEYRWNQWKAEEEKILREQGVDEETIQKLREYDWNDFNAERRFREHQTSLLDCMELLLAGFDFVREAGTLNPETRMMKRVEIEDARMASDVTEILMGSDVPPRKAFIYEHATDAELDI